MALWYVKNTGSDLNSGSSDTDAAKVTRDAGTPGALVAGQLDDAGATFITSGVVPGDAINLIVGGVQTVRFVATVPLETRITITAPPADGNYNYRVGGRRASINKAANAGAGNNTALAASDRVWVRQHSTGTYNELVVLDTAITLIGPGPAISLIDGTGLGAGSDVISIGAAAAVVGVKVVNAVDRGFSRTAASPGEIRDCVVETAGGDGFNIQAAGKFFNCSARACGDDGFDGTTITLYGCQARDCTSDGVAITSATGSPDYIGILSTDNGAAGIVLGGGTSTRRIEECTLANNGTSGLLISAVDRLGTGSRIWNCAFTGNTGYGVNSSAGAQTNMYLAGYNCYFGNTTSARNNFDADTFGGTTSDPQYSGAGNYSPSRNGSLYKAGSPAWDDGNYTTIGAVSPVTSAEDTILADPDYPVEDDVLDGVSYANGTKTGNVVLPAEAEVKTGITFGPSGSLTGTYSGSGGGGRGFFPTNAAQRRR